MYVSVLIAISYNNNNIITMQKHITADINMNINSISYFKRRNNRLA